MDERTPGPEITLAERERADHLSGRSGRLLHDEAWRVKGRSIAAIVVAHNSAAVLDACLDSLAVNMKFEPGLSVVVVDNGSTDDTVSRAMRIRLSQMWVQQNLGCAAGINGGIATLDDRTSQVLVLNPDVRLEARTLTRLADAIEKSDIRIARELMAAIESLEGGEESWFT